MREQNALDPRRKVGIGENLLEIADEYVATRRRDAAKLLGARAFKEYGADQTGGPVILEQTFRLHPGERGLAQIDPLGIQMPELRLVADDHDRVAGATRALKERGEPFEGLRAVEPTAIDIALKLALSGLAAGSKPNRVANLLLAPHEIGRREAALLSR